MEEIVQSGKRQENYDLKVSEETCEFLGWHMGDGCISKTKRYSEFALTGDIIEELPFYKEIVLPTLNALFKTYLRKPLELKLYKTTGVCGIYIFDRNFVDMLQNDFGLKEGKKICMELPRCLKTYKQKVCFVRGLYDTDGSIYFCRSNFKTKNKSPFATFHYRPKIKIATISKLFMEQLLDLLLSLGFSPRWSKPAKERLRDNTMYAVVLDTMRDTKRWVSEVGFRSPKHITKIQVWQKFGFCPPHTTLAQRIEMLNGRLNPLSFYPSDSNFCLQSLLQAFKEWHV